MSGSVVINPPYIGEIGMTENIEDMLFGYSIGYEFHDSIVDEGDNGIGEEEDFSDDEEANFEDDNFLSSESIPDVPTQVIYSYDQSNWHFWNLFFQRTRYISILFHAFCFGLLVVQVHLLYLSERNIDLLPIAIKKKQKKKT